MKKLIKFNGKIKTITEHILDENNKLIVCFFYDHKKNKNIIQYRLFSNDKTFMIITKYQAKKHLNKDQLEAEEWFYQCLPFFRDMQFNKKLDFIKMIKKDRDDLICGISTMFDIMKNKEYCECE